MNKIVILPSEISLKIAAGEVVERPFSVVKELVENSLDAGAKNIRVEVGEGGKTLIRVTDDGCGMTREDALVCFERHSTSKIRREEDLSQIFTLGFRGEALPSISAVSRMTLRTSSGEGGTLISREGESVLEVSDTAFPQGTSVEVRDLFFNLPARRKFLRAEKSELSQTAAYLADLSLAYPEVRFSLALGKRQVFDYPAVGSLRERIYQVCGQHLLERLIELRCEDNQGRVSGYVSHPPLGRKDRRRQLFFVNRRMVKDRTLQAALKQAFTGLLEKGHFPEAFIFLEIPYSEVDVNVHPAKTEVRFRDSSAVFHLVRGCSEQAVLRELGVKAVYPSPWEEKPSLRVEELTKPLGFPAAQKMAGPFPQPEQSAKGFAETRFQVLGQYLDIYIVAVDREGVLIIDQHNAHERVLFEKYQEVHFQKKWPRKLALLPLVMELTPFQALCFEENQALLEELGFRVEPMGGRSLSLMEYPDIFQEKEARDIFFSLLEEAGVEMVQDKQKRLLATLACKTAVKAGFPLSFERMRYLVEELFNSTHPSLCPHGRPISLRVSRKEIEKGLKRS